MNIKRMAEEIVEDELLGLCRYCDYQHIENVVFDKSGEDCSIADYNALLDRVNDMLDSCDNCKEEHLYDIDEDEYQDGSRYSD